MVGCFIITANIFILFVEVFHMLLSNCCCCEKRMARTHVGFHVGKQVSSPGKQLPFTAAASAQLARRRLINFISKLIYWFFLEIDLTSEKSINFLSNHTVIFHTTVCAMYHPSLRMWENLRVDPSDGRPTDAATGWTPWGTTSVTQVRHCLTGTHVHSVLVDALDWASIAMER